MLAHYASGHHKLARLWKITRLDDELFGFTDHDVPITYEAVIYVPSSVYDASAISTSSELNVDNLETQGLLAEAGITAESIEKGRWDGASFVVYEVVVNDLAAGHNILRSGEFGSLQRGGTNGYTTELRGIMAKLQNNIGRVVKPSCDARLGDARCKIDIEALRVTGTVTVVTDNRSFEISIADANFTGGLLTWTDGLNDGLSMEVKEIDSDGVFYLQLPMPYDVEVGDGFSIVPGCDKTKTMCKDVYENVINFRGFSFVPGSDAVLKIGSQ
jgi:uncharacterized phage protein (TIGR02218 family)